jgi:signal transduction histidine kinase
VVEHSAMFARVVAVKAAPRAPGLARQRALLAGAVGLVIIAAVALLDQPSPPWLQTPLRFAVIMVLPVTVSSSVLWHLLMRERSSSSRILAIARHAGGAALFSAALTAAIIGVAYLVGPEEARAFLRSGDPAWQFLYGFVIYGAIAAAVRAVRAQARLKERELAAARAELQALRARLDPHFLFNTLHSLTQLARDDPGATEDALEQFANLMRYVLNAGREPSAEVALEDELAFVHHYLAIERLRLGERLRVVENVDTEALELAVPPLLLQPLVENAVRHGLAPRRAGCTIRLDIHADDDSLSIAVIDDGNGADPDALHESAGLGLKAVRRQIEARFPDEGKFAVTTRPGAGFAVHLTLPAHPPTAGTL